MFRWLHTYYNTMLDKPSILFPVNLYSYVNIRYFKFKYIRNIYIFISTMDSLKMKFIKIIYRDWLFENFFQKFFIYAIFLVVLLFVI